MRKWPQLHQRKFRLHIWKNYFVEREVRLQNRLPGEVAEPNIYNPLELLKRGVAVVLGDAV